MTTPNDRKAASAFTRASVEAYLQAAAAERLRIELAITEARARTERARRKQHRLAALEDEAAEESDADPHGMIVQLRSAIADDEAAWLQSDRAATVAGE
jgi:hypothetical protein